LSNPVGHSRVDILRAPSTGRLHAAGFGGLDGG